MPSPAISRRSAALGLLALLAMAGAAWPQGPTAAVVGTVTDSSGGAISGAAVQVRHLESGFEQIATTNLAGAFRMVGLQAGTHDLIVSTPQFSTVRQSGIVLRASAKRSAPTCRSSLVRSSRPSR